MKRESTPTPIENKGSKPYRIYADVYGDPKSRSHRPISDAMSPVLICLAPMVRLDEVRQLLLRQRLSGAPVLDEDQQLLGVISWQDLLSSPGDYTAVQVMHHALTLPTWTPIGKAAAIMSSESVDLAAVVDVNQRVQGLLSALDIARWLARDDGYVLR